MVIWTNCCQSSFHAMGRIGLPLFLLLFIFLLQSVVTEAQSENDPCKGVEEAVARLQRGEIPETFPHEPVEGDKCSLARLAKPLADQARELFDTHDPEKIQRLLAFLAQAKEKCQDPDIAAVTAMKTLAQGLDETGDVPVDVVPERNPNWCESLQPLVERLENSMKIMDVFRAEISRYLYDPATLKSLSTELQPLVADQPEDHEPQHRELGTEDTGLKASGSGTKLLATVSLGVSLLTLTIIIIVYSTKLNIPGLGTASHKAPSGFKNPTRRGQDLAKLEDDLNKLWSRVGSFIEPQLDSLRADLSAQGSSLSQAQQPNQEHLVTVEQLKPFRQELNQLIAQVENLRAKAATPSPPSQRQPASSVGPPPPLELIVDIEWGVLERRWNHFKENRKDIHQRIWGWDNSEEQRLAVDLLRRLPEELEAQPELQHGLRSASRSLYEDYTRLTILSGFSRLNDTLPSSGGSDELREIKKYQNHLSQIRNIQDLLALIETTDVGREMEKFTFKRWVREEFLGFADSFFKIWAVPENASRLRNARAIGLKTLHYAGVEPIEIELGRTQFDSKIQVARSDSCEPDKPDGAIVGIVRSGFRDLEKDRILQRPEVVVNRV